MSLLPRRTTASRGHRTTVGCLLVSLLIAAAVDGGAHAADHAPSPTQWPDNSVVAARLSGAPNAVRFYGRDRSQTSLALALALRGAGGFPFTSPNPSGGQPPQLAEANHWWGLDACPRSIIVVAGDVAADALAASALSDATGRSTEPFLARSASADPLFDPIGSFARVDTDAAPILVTRSARQGATALTAAARIAAQDLRNGGCTTARQAIIIGGNSAVPAGVEAELISLGYGEVFRVAGENRYATAAAVARSLGTAPIPAGTPGCAEPDAGAGPLAMRFIANSVIEYRPSPTQCRLLGRTVVVADGITGADALAAGWWTGFAQVPVVLHSGGSTLPTATAAYLATEPIDNVLVLGGTARITDSVVAEIAKLTGAQPIRIAGANRSATSIAMAGVFGGWFPQLGAPSVAGSMLCLAASSGEGLEARGWPDALSGGPWCASATAATAATTRALAPLRGLDPVDGPAPQTTTATTPQRAAVPIILVPFGATRLPEVVASFLSSSFDASASWCSSAARVEGCLTPGFAVFLGGPAALPESVVGAVSATLSGTASPEERESPSLSDPFVTRLDLSPVFNESGNRSVCASRGSYHDARWLAVFEDATEVGRSDVFLDGRYVADADGVTRSPTIGAPTCVATATDGGAVTVRAVGPAGRVSPDIALSTDPSSRITIFPSLQADGPVDATGLPASDIDSPGGVSTRTFVTAFGDLGPQAVLSLFGATSPIVAASLTFTLTRGAVSPTSPTVVTGTVSVTTTTGVISGTVTAEAINVSGRWEIRGRVDFEGGLRDSSAAGGFSATWRPGDAVVDESIAWLFDASRS